MSTAEQLLLTFVVAVIISAVAVLIIRRIQNRRIRVTLSQIYDHLHEHQRFAASLNQRIKDEYDINVDESMWSAWVAFMQAGQIIKIDATATNGNHVTVSIWLDGADIKVGWLEDKS